MSCPRFPSLVGSTLAPARAVAALRDFESGKREQDGGKEYVASGRLLTAVHIWWVRLPANQLRDPQNIPQTRWFSYLRNTTFKTQNLSVTPSFLSAPSVPLSSRPSKLSSFSIPPSFSLPCSSIWYHLRQGLLLLFHPSIQAASRKLPLSSFNPLYSIPQYILHLKSSWNPNLWPPCVLFFILHLPIPPSSPPSYHPFNLST